MKTKTFIVIDTENQQVKEVEMEGTLEDFQKVVGGYIEPVYLDRTDCMYVNEEGLYDPELKWFAFKGAHQPFKGNAVIVGTTAGGRTVAPKVTLEKIKELVVFPPE